MRKMNFLGFHCSFAHREEEPGKVGRAHKCRQDGQFWESWTIFGKGSMKLVQKHCNSFLRWCANPGLEFIILHRILAKELPTLSEQLQVVTKRRKKNRCQHILPMKFGRQNDNASCWVGNVVCWSWDKKCKYFHNSLAAHSAVKIWLMSGDVV